MLKFKFFTKSIIYIVQENYFPVRMKFVIQSTNPETFQQDNCFTLTILISHASQFYYIANLLIVVQKFLSHEAFYYKIYVHLNF